MSIQSASRESVHVSESKQTKQPRWHWYHGAIFYLMIQVMTFSLAGLVSSLKGEEIKKARDLFGDTNYFKNLHQVKITPPSWFFAPAWTVNNFGSIYGMLRVLNKPASTRGRSEYLALQSASWVNYVVFSAAYFSLRSPLNALALTLSMLALTIVSEFVAVFRLKDTFVALSLATLLIWLVVASTSAIFQSAWNEDDFYGVGPFFEPVPALEKQEVQ